MCSSRLNALYRSLNQLARTSVQDTAASSASSASASASASASPSALFVSLTLSGASRTRSPSLFYLPLERLESTIEKVCIHIQLTFFCED
jgi:hypothetical protein